MLRLGSTAAGVLGWFASVAIHGVAALVATGVISPIPVINFVQEWLADEPEQAETPDRGPERSPEDEPEPVVEPEPLRVRLGIDESEATDTETWLGFATASPDHGGLMIGFEQAQLTRSPGEGGDPLPPQVGPASLMPDRAGAPSAPSALSVESTTRQGEPAETPEPSPTDSPTFLSPTATPTITLARMETPSVNAPGAAQGGGAPSPSSAPATSSASSGAVASAPGSAQAVDESAKPKDEPVDLSAPGARGERERGFLSDRDADAAAIRTAILASPGRPLAAKGLRIQTVRPQFSAYALATANPDDVVVRIWFNAQGRVAKADLLQSSGRADVDRPVLDAVYNWRATGEPLKTLLNSGPDARIELVFRVTLRR